MVPSTRIDWGSLQICDEGKSLPYSERRLEAVTYILAGQCVQYTGKVDVWHTRYDDIIYFVSTSSRADPALLDSGQLHKTLRISHRAKSSMADV